MRRWLVVLLIASFFPRVAHAQLPLGATAPAYTKSLLGGGTLTNTTYAGKVVVMFMLGYG